MNQIKKHIEQFEEASKFLRKESSTHARLALMLLDNLAELFMYNRIHDEFMFDSRSWRVGSQKYSIRKREKTLSEFKKMVTFLVDELLIIDADDGEILKIGHKLRNEAYHRGVVRKSIIKEVARSYLTVDARLMPALWTRSYVYTASNETTLFLKKYGLESTSISEDTLKRICDSILGDNACSPNNLSSALSNDLLRRFEELCDGLRALTEDDYIGGTLEEILKSIQFHVYFLKNYDPPTGDDHASFVKYHCDRKDWLNAYEPPVTLAILDRWKRQAENIRDGMMPGASLKKYFELDKNMHPIEELTNEAISHCEMNLDMQSGGRM